jgi:hypothetical protein
VQVDDEAGARRVLEGIAGASLDPDHEPQDGRVVIRLAPPATSAALNAALVHAGVGVSELVAEHERLEDVFLELVEERTSTARAGTGTGTVGAANAADAPADTNRRD